MFGGVGGGGGGGNTATANPFAENAGVIPTFGAGGGNTATANPFAGNPFILGGSTSPAVDAAAADRILPSLPSIARWPTCIESV